MDVAARSSTDYQAPLLIQSEKDAYQSITINRPALSITSEIQKIFGEKTSLLAAHFDTCMDRLDNNETNMNTLQMSTYYKLYKSRHTVNCTIGIGGFVNMCAAGGTVVALQNFPALGYLIGSTVVYVVSLQHLTFACYNKETLYTNLLTFLGGDIKKQSKALKAEREKFTNLKTRLESTKDFLLAAANFCISWETFKAKPGSEVSGIKKLFSDLSAIGHLKTIHKISVWELLLLNDVCSLLPPKEQMVGEWAAIKNSTQFLISTQSQIPYPLNLFTLKKPECDDYRTFLRLIQSSSWSSISDYLKTLGIKQLSDDDGACKQYLAS